MNNEDMCNKLETKDYRRKDLTEGHLWLVMCGGDELKTQIFLNMSKGRYDTRSIPGMTNKRFFSNWNEWFVLSDYSNKECSLLNVISMEKVELPIYDKMFMCRFCTITCSPEDPNCRVVFIDRVDYNMCICQPGDNKFEKKKLQFPEGESFHGAIHIDGNIFILLFPSLSLTKGDLNDPTNEFQTIINGESMQNELLDFIDRARLTNSCGELLMVYEYRLNNEESYVFQVFRADFSTSEWVLLTSIGDRTIFLDSLSNDNICCSSSCFRLQRNCIYYVTENNDRAVYIFNMEDQSTTMFIPCPTIQLLDLTPRWVMSHSSNF